VRLLIARAQTSPVTDARLATDHERLRPASKRDRGDSTDLNQQASGDGAVRIYAKNQRRRPLVVIAPLWGRLLSTYPKSQHRDRGGRCANRLMQSGFDAGSDRRQGAGRMIACWVRANEGSSWWRADLFSAAAPAAHARDLASQQHHYILGVAAPVGVAAPAAAHIAPKFRWMAGWCERCQLAVRVG